jgi:hypothetical protein
LRTTKITQTQIMEAPDEQPRKATLSAPIKNSGRLKICITLRVDSTPTGLETESRHAMLNHEAVDEPIS